MDLLSHKIHEAETKKSLSKSFLNLTIKLLDIFDIVTNGFLNNSSRSSTKTPNKRFSKDEILIQIYLV